MQWRLCKAPANFLCFFKYIVSNYSEYEYFSLLGKDLMLSARDSLAHILRLFCSHVRAKLLIVNINCALYLESEISIENSTVRKLSMKNYTFVLRYT